MSLYHRATLTPTKQQLLASWVPSQRWGPADADDLMHVGSFRFDDPEGEVGMETHLLRHGGTVLQVPLTYREAALEGADEAFITTMEHSALGTRYVYDGVRDPRYVTILAAATLTGQGEALGMVYDADRWFTVPSSVRIHGGGWGADRVAVDGFELLSDDGAAVLRNERFELRLHRYPMPGPRPAIGLVASWATADEPVVITEIREV
jgi:hypothetical protein